MRKFPANPTGDARERKRLSVRHGLSTKSPTSLGPTSVDHSAHAIAQSRFQTMVDRSARAQHSTQFQAMVDHSPRQMAQRQALEQLSDRRSREKRQGDGSYAYASGSESQLSNAAVLTIGRQGAAAILPTFAPNFGGRRADSKTPHITTSVQRYAEGARPEAYRENSMQMHLDRDVMQARFYSGGNAYVAQMVDWAYWSKLGSGFLVFSEGAMTVAAGSLAINVNPMAAIPTIVTGGVKLIRGGIMMGETLISGSYPDPEHQVNKVLRGLTKSLRTLEAIGAGLAVGLGAKYTLENQQKLVTELVALGSSFAGIKLLRSLGHWFVDNGKPSYGSMVLQGVEALEGALLAIGAAWQRTIPGTGLAASVGGAKIVRGTAGAITHGVKRKQQGVSSERHEGYTEI